MQQLLQAPVDELTYEQLDTLVRYLNDAYRGGDPLVSDETFDHVYLKALREYNPDHEFFIKPQPEQESSKGRVHHGTRRMLSTQKAYEVSEIESWVKRCQNAALEIGVDPDSLEYRLSPKLDGIAGRFEPSPKRLITRGDGDYGYDVSHLFDHGLVIKGESHDHAVGEIIMDEQYYQDFLTEITPHPRNFVSGMASADELNEHALTALKSGAVHLVLYKYIDTQYVDAATLVNNLDSLVAGIQEQSAYRLDGVVIEITSEDVKQHMQSTNHHHNWQIAKKQVGETALAIVEDIVWQPSRTGRINPVIQIESTFLDGCNIQRITAHHAGHLKRHGIGKGAKIEIVRSGSVIPTLVKTHDSVAVELPRNCPCCDHYLEWDGDYLVCNGTQCDAQSATKIEHHMKTIQADLFGPKTVQKLVEAGYDSIEKIYPLVEQDYLNAGFGPGQAKNIVNELIRVKREPLRDFLLLGSLGIKGLGKGASKKLLAHYSIDDVLSLNTSDIIAIDGFGDITSSSIVADLQDSAETLRFLLELGFNLSHSKQESRTVAKGPLAGLHVVFTGKMSGNRVEMQEQAQAYGGICQSSINKKTQLLICGDSVGNSKLIKAKTLGVRIISESDYLSEFID